MYLLTSDRDATNTGPWGWRVTRNGVLLGWWRNRRDAEAFLGSEAR